MLPVKFSVEEQRISFLFFYSMARALPHIADGIPSRGTSCSTKRRYLTLVVFEAVFSSISKARRGWRRRLVLAKPVMRRSEPHCCTVEPGGKLTSVHRQSNRAINVRRRAIFSSACVVYALAQRSMHRQAPAIRVASSLRGRRVCAPALARVTDRTS